MRRTVCLWSACLLLWVGCEESESDHCVPGESVACQGTDGCEGVKVCDTNGLVYGNCQCVPPAVTPPTRPPGGTAAACLPGQTRACLGSNECTGTATCNDSGTFGACQCNEPPTTVPAVRPNVLGAACRTNRDCGSSLICWAESEQGPVGSVGSPGRGYCTAPCQTTADCTLFQGTGDCLHFSQTDLGVCLASCSTSGGDCGGRSDLSCTAYATLSLTAPAAAPEAGLCVPHCRSDADCPSGGQCNLAEPIASCIGGGPDAGVSDAGP